MISCVLLFLLAKYGLHEIENHIQLFSSVYDCKARSVHVLVATALKSIGSFVNVRLPSAPRNGSQNSRIDGFCPFFQSHLLYSKPVTVLFLSSPSSRLCVFVLYLEPSTGYHMTALFLLKFPRSRVQGGLSRLCSSRIMCTASGEWERKLQVQDTGPNRIQFELH